MGRPVSTNHPPHPLTVGSHPSLLITHIILIGTFYSQSNLQRFTYLSEYGYCNSSFMTYFEKFTGHKW
uniref:Uncharacterized protein n=1 Tax=Anguilla anguilla TaxID=7936 RepID=A0A0E9WH45_ANGAN